MLTKKEMIRLFSTKIAAGAGALGLLLLAAPLAQATDVQSTPGRCYSHTLLREHPDFESRISGTCNAGEKFTAWCYTDTGGDEPWVKITTETRDFGYVPWSSVHLENSQGIGDCDY